ncbi:hypothetical protein DFH06DRAFT_1140340 [Mycena polygramma]|nr:hypothetical protein DFH06DRAFT_1140340 [Mycena polygramma]
MIGMGQQQWKHVDQSKYLMEYVKKRSLRWTVGPADFCGHAHVIGQGIRGQLKGFCFWHQDMSDKQKLLMKTNWTAQWKGGKGVVNDPDRSRGWGRAEDRRRPEVSRADGEVARADRSTEGQRPEVVQTEVGGRTRGEPELLKYGGASDQKGKENKPSLRDNPLTPRVAERSEDLGAAESAESARLIGIGGGIIGDGESGCTDITVSPLYVPCPQGTEGQRTIRTDRTCGSWKAGKCREHGGNPEGEGVSEDERDTEVKPEEDRRDRRMTNEEGEDVERGRMMMEATGGGRSIGSAETRKVNQDNRKRRKPRRRSKVDTEAHGGARGQSIPERPKSRSFREGQKRESAWPHGRKLAEKSFYGVAKGNKMKVRARARTATKSRKQEQCRMGYREGVRKAEGKPEAPKWKTEDGKAGVSAELDGDLKQVKVVRERDRNHRPRPRGHRRREKEVKGERGEDGKPPTSSGSDSGPRPRKPKPERELENCHIVEFRLGSETAQAGTGQKERMWKETKDDRRWRTRIGEWNEKSRSLMDQCSISEARRFGVGVVATSERGLDVQLGRKILAKSNGLETRRLVEGNVNAKLSKVGSEVGSRARSEMVSDSETEG